MKYKFLFALICCMGIAPASAQVSTLGTDFYVAFGRNLTQYSGTYVYQIRIVATQAADITFTFNEDATIVDTIHVNAGEVYSYNLDATQRAKVYSSVTGTSYKSLRIESTTPVSVYALNQIRGSADATNLLPVNTLGTDYYHISYKSYLNDAYLVIATENATKVYDGATEVATLNAGQVYASYHSGDITGKHITSDKPIAYFVANDEMHVPAGISYLECLFQQMAPVDTWGRTFLVPVTHRGIERVRIVASQNDTQVSQTGGTKKIDGGGGAQNPPDQNSFTLNAGQYVELEITLAGHGCYIVADKPVGVTSYLTGAGYSGLSEMKGDPALAWVPPIEQTINSAAIAPFVSTEATVMDEHHALIVTATATHEHTTLAIGNNAAAPLSGGTWTTGVAGNGLDGSVYSFYSLQLTDATSSYFFANPNGLFILGYGIGYVSGWGESYYYLAGASARNLSAGFYVNETYYQNINEQTFCGAAQRTLSFEGTVQNAKSTSSGYLKWYINGTPETSATDQLQWDKTFNSGVYHITMEVLDVEDQTHTFSTTITVSTCMLPVNPHLMIRYE
jgi:hypothetical protein